MKTILQNIANECRTISGKNQTELRSTKFEELCAKNGIGCTFVGEKAGAKACLLVELKDVYRFFPRAGKGRYNYAPCYEVEKKK